LVEAFTVSLGHTTPHRRERLKHELGLFLPFVLVVPKGSQTMHVVRASEKKKGEHFMSIVPFSFGTYAKDFVNMQRTVEKMKLGLLRRIILIRCKCRPTRGARRSSKWHVHTSIEE
jgi:tartrate dehydratase beta subunit/fumarate hydratase class I family protein